MNIIRQLNATPLAHLRVNYMRLFRKSSSKPEDVLTQEENVLIDSEEVEAARIQREEQIEKSRNKSRLYPDHYRQYHGINPYPEPVTDYHLTVRYKRRTYGKYGEATSIDPSVLWPTKEELASRLEYEALAHPYTISEMVDRVKQRKAEEAKVKKAREDDVAAKAMKVEQWKKEFHEKVKKKAEEAAAAKERKDRLVEEIRRHFGFKIDPRDDRFKEMMEKKEKEAKKLSKAEKQKARDMKLMAEAQAAEEIAKEEAVDAAEKEADEAEKVTSKK